MQVFGSPVITGIGFILTGYYSYTISGNKKPKLFELSSPIYPISQFTAPYDAYLKNKALNILINCLLAGF